MNKTDTTVAPVEVILPDYVPANTGEKNIVALGKKIVKQSLKTGLLYMELAKEIRESHTGPKTVSDLLRPLGFIKQRISELNKIAAAPEDAWQRIDAAGLGFKKAIEIARGSQAEDVAVAMLGLSEEEIAGAERELPPDEGGDEGEAKPVSMRDRIRKVCEKAAHLAAGSNIKSLSYTFKDDLLSYSVTVKRKGKLPKVGHEDVAPEDIRKGKLPKV